jgi:CheY-specific phosphatase CheX
MFETIVQATENFCTHQIREPFQEIEIFDDTNAIITYIDITTEDDTKHRVYVVSDKGFAQKVSQLFLEEDESDEETLKDMALETTNLIVGSAKVIAQESAQSYTIGTPHFTDIGNFNAPYKKQKSYNLDEKSNILIAIEELDG